MGDETASNRSVRSISFVAFPVVYTHTRRLYSMIYEGSSFFSLTGFYPFISVQGETSVLWLNIGDCVLVCWFSLTNINSSKSHYGSAVSQGSRTGGETEAGVFVVSCRVVSERCSFAAASLACSPPRATPSLSTLNSPPQIENSAEQRQNATRRVTHELLNYLPCTSVVAKTVASSYSFALFSCSSCSPVYLSLPPELV